MPRANKGLLSIRRLARYELGAAETMFDVGTGRVFAGAGRMRGGGPRLPGGVPVPYLFGADERESSLAVCDPTRRRECGDSQLVKKESAAEILFALFHAGN